MKSEQPNVVSRGVRFWMLYAFFLFIVAAAAILVCEVGIRLFVSASVWKHCVAKDDWQPDVELGWANIPDLDVIHRDDGPEIRFRLNPDGLQPVGANEDRTEGVARVMIFGDSCTVGRAVLEPERLANQLQKSLSSSVLAVEVICAGVQGYSTDQSLILMRRLLPRYKPDLVIHMFCDNDLGGNESSEAYGLAKPRFQLNTAGGLDLVPTTHQQIEARWSNAWGGGVGRLLQFSALYRVIRPALFRFRYGSEGDWAQQNLVGGAAGAEQVAMLEKADWKLFSALLSAMKETCSQNGARFVLTEHPHAWEVWDQGAAPEHRLWLDDRLSAVAAESGVSFSSTVPYFIEHRSDGPFHLLPRDPHCNGKGYETSAGLLAAHIRQHQLLSAAPFPSPTPQP